MQIPNNTKYIEIYRNETHQFGVRSNVYEIFLTDSEVTDDQTMSFFNEI